MRPSVSPRISVPVKFCTSTRSLDLDRHVLGDDDPISAALANLEPHRHRARVADRCTQPRNPLEPLSPTLRLLGVLSRDVARDVILLRRNLRLLLVELALLREPAQRALLDERFVAPRVRSRAVAFEVQHVIDDRCEKRAIVADQQHRRR